jgi:inorganic pyrophosphatase
MSIYSIDPGTPEAINVIVEIPQGSSNKYEYDVTTGLIKLDRANFGPTPYPTNYGFIPGTLGEDGDAYDVLLLSSFPIHPGILVEARPVALMKMTDEGDVDDKIICVPVKDRRFEDVLDVGDLNKHTLKEIKLFFETIKLLKAKPGTVTVHGFEDRAAALTAFEYAKKAHANKKN